MKKMVFVLIILLIFPTAAFSAERTLLGDREIDHGGYGGPVIKIGAINSQGALFLGGCGGWIIDHTFVIGGGGYGLVNDIRSAGNRIDLGYGGLLLEYIMGSDNLVHLNPRALIGYGWIAYDVTDSVDDGYFAFEPGINVEVNITPWLRVSGGVQYLLTSGIGDIPGLDEKDVNGPSVLLVFKFGAF